MHWLYKGFKDYCYKNNIQLLRDDFLFIEQVLDKIPSELHRSIMYDYTRRWLLGVKKEEKSLLKQNSGRKLANSWLREQAAKK
jgi:hypothetical protein